MLSQSIGRQLACLLMPLEHGESEHTPNCFAKQGSRRHVHTALGVRTYVAMTEGSSTIVDNHRATILIQVMLAQGFPIIAIITVPVVHPPTTDSVRMGLGKCVKFKWGSLCQMQWSASAHHIARSLTRSLAGSGNGGQGQTLVLVMARQRTSCCASARLSCFAFPQPS